MDKDNQRLELFPNLFEMVKEFNRKFNIPLNEKPGRCNPELEHLGYRHLSEEIRELADSCTLYDELDSLVDIVYVTMGLAAKYGFDFNEAFRRVHIANMTKTRAQAPEESKRGSQWDIIKG